MGIRRANDIARKVHPGALYLVNESIGPSGESNASRATKPIVFRCQQCSAGLQVDGSSRLVECSYCSASNYLPDGLWMQFHPVATKQTWFIILAV